MPGRQGFYLPWWYIKGMAPQSFRKTFLDCQTGRFFFFYFFFPVAQSHLTLYDLMDCSMLGLPVLHHLLEFAQTHVRWIDDAIQSSHPLLPPSPPAFNLSREYIFLGSLSRHNKNLGWRTLKPLGGSQLLEDRQCYSSSINQCYSSVLQLYLFR